MGKYLSTCNNFQFSSVLIRSAECNYSSLIKYCPKVFVSRFKNNVRINDKELELLEAINTLGPCSSEKVHESIEPKVDYLLVMRTLHGLVQKGFLQRIIINKKQLYRTSRQYSYIKSFLNNSQS